MTTMFTNKTPGVVAAEIEMLRAVDLNTSFIVEGHDDSRFWKARTASQVTIVDCEGKRNLLEVARQAGEAGKDYIFGVYDADFDHLSGIRHHSKLLAITDENDLEITLLRSTSLSWFLDHLADQIKVKSFEATVGVTVSDYIESVARSFGELRFLNQTHSYGVNFDHLSPYRFISSTAWQLDKASLQKEFAAHAGLTLSDLREKLEGLCHYGKWTLVQGHDCIKILTQGMKKVLSNKQSNEGDVTQMLALGFDNAKLAATRMYSDICSIEVRYGIKLLKL